MMDYAPNTTNTTNTTNTIDSNLTRQLERRTIPAPRVRRLDIVVTIKQNVLLLSPLRTAPLELCRHQGVLPFRAGELLGVGER